MWWRQIIKFGRSADATPLPTGTRITMNGKIRVTMVGETRVIQ